MPNRLQILDADPAETRPTLEWSFQDQDLEQLGDLPQLEVLLRKLTEILPSGNRLSQATHQFYFDGIGKTTLKKSYGRSWRQTAETASWARPYTLSIHSQGSVLARGTCRPHQRRGDSSRIKWHWLILTSPRQILRDSFNCSIRLRRTRIRLITLWRQNSDWLK